MFSIAKNYKIKKNYFLKLLYAFLISDDSKNSSTISVSDCRSLVKTLVCGVKTITWGAASCKVTDVQLSGNRQFLAHETTIFTKLVKYALKALDVYQVHS